MKQEEIFLSEGKKKKEKKSFWKSKKVILIAIAVLALIGTIVIRGRDKEEEKVKEEVPKEVSTIEISMGGVQDISLEKTVRIVSEDEASAVAEYSGRIKQVFFDIGDKVVRGQKLAVFEDANTGEVPSIDLSLAREAADLANSSLKSTKKSADKDIKMAKNNVELAKLALESAKRGDEGASSVKVAEENLEAAKRQRDKTEILADQQIDAAKNARSAAQKSESKARLGYNKTIITAPASGIVTKKNISENAYLNSGTVVAVVGTSSRLEANLSLSKKEIEGLKKEDSVEVKCNDNYLNIGEIRGVSRIAESDNLRYGVSIGFENKDCIEPNKFIKVKLKIPFSCTDSCYLPLSAVNIGQNRNTIFVVEDGIAKSREIKTGKIIGESIHVTEGLNQGDLVVNEGSKNIREGDKVTF